MFSWWRHTVRIWKQMDTRIWNVEFRAKVVPNLVDNHSIEDPNTMPTKGHTTVAEQHTMAAEPYTIETKPHTMAVERCEFSSSSLPEGHTIATWCVRTKSRRPPDGKKHLADYDHSLDDWSYENISNKPNCTQYCDFQLTKKTFLNDFIFVKWTSYSISLFQFIHLIEKITIT